MKRTTLISVAIASVMSAVATNSFGNTVVPSAAQKAIYTSGNYNATRGATFDDAWRKPDYSKKFKEGKFFYYVISEAQKTVGVAPYSGIDNVYQHSMEVPETITQYLYCSCYWACCICEHVQFAKCQTSQDDPIYRAGCFLGSFNSKDGNS